MNSHRSPASPALAACAAGLAAQRRRLAASGSVELQDMAGTLQDLLEGLRASGARPPEAGLLDLLEELEQLVGAVARARDDAAAQLGELGRRGRASRAYRGA